MISLAGWARAVRDHRHLTRREAECATGVSVDYLKNIENGWRPSVDYLEKLITGYRLDCSQKQLTWDLWRPPCPLRPVEQLREQIDTPDRLALLTRLDRSGVAAAYIDPLWNILTANNTYYQALPAPGKNTGGNYATWAMPPAPEPSPVKPLLLEPESEGALLVGMLRASFARYRSSPHVPELFDRLSRNDTFTRHWNSGIHVTYGRRIEQPLQLRTPDTGAPYSLDVQITDLAHFPEVRTVLAWPPP